MRADGHHTARYPYGILCAASSSAVERAYSATIRGIVCVHIILARVSLKAQFNDRLEFLLALLDQVGKFVFGHRDYLQSVESFDKRINPAL